MTNKDDFSVDTENNVNNLFSTSTDDDNSSVYPDDTFDKYKTITNRNKNVMNDSYDLENSLNVAKTQVMPESLAKAISQSIQEEKNDDDDGYEESFRKRRQIRENDNRHHKSGCLLLIILLFILLIPIIWCIQNQDKLDPKLSNIIRKSENLLLEGKNFIKNKINQKEKEQEKDFEHNEEEPFEILDSNNLTIKENDVANKSTSSNTKDFENKNNLEDPNEIKEEDIVLNQEDFKIEDNNISENKTEPDENSKSEKINVIIEERNIEENSDDQKEKSAKKNISDNNSSPLSLELSLMAKQLDDIEKGKYIEIEFDDKIPSQDDDKILTSQEVTPYDQATNNTQNEENDNQDTSDSKIQALIVKFGKTNDEAKLLTSIIESQCNKYDLSSPLMTSVIAAGSSFNEDFESSNGKIGLFQISENELNEIIRLSNNQIKKGNLKDINYNLNVGFWYMNYLKTQFNNDIKKAVIAKIIGINELNYFIEKNLPFPQKVQQHLGQIGIIYKFLTKKLNISNKNQNIRNNTINDDKSTNKVEEISISNITETPASVEAVTENNEISVKRTKKINAKLSAKNIILAKDLPNILKWTVVPDDEISDMTQIVTSIAKQYNFDPLFIAAIIMSESSFNSEIVSESGKIGLLQINPEQAPEITKLLEIEWLGSEALKDPEYNLKLGVGFLNYCLQKHKNDFNGGMYAYNQGDDTKELDENAQILFNRYLDNIKFYLKSWGGRLPK